MEKLSFLLTSLPWASSTVTNSATDVQRLFKCLFECSEHQARNKLIIVYTALVLIYSVRAWSRGINLNLALACQHHIQRAHNRHGNSFLVASSLHHIRGFCNLVMETVEGKGAGS